VTMRELTVSYRNVLGCRPASAARQWRNLHPAWQAGRARASAGARRSCSAASRTAGGYRSLVFDRMTKTEPAPSAARREPPSRPARRCPAQLDVG
jgi:hypothetical protein